MERRKFFKSLGLLSLAAIAPKFLLGKKNTQIESGNFSEECSNRVETINGGRAVSFYNNSKERFRLMADMQVLPLAYMTMDEWQKSLKNDRVLYYSSEKTGIRPAEIAEGLNTNSCKYFLILDMFPHSMANKNYHAFELLKNIDIVDKRTGWFIDKNGFQNYMSIQRHPDFISGEEEC